MRKRVPVIIAAAAVAIGISCSEPESERRQPTAPPSPSFARGGYGGGGRDQGPIDLGVAIERIAAGRSTGSAHGDGEPGQRRNELYLDVDEYRRRDHNERARH